MSENSELSVGQVLLEARKAQGFTLEDVAMRLRLMQRQVEAMEADDFESLGQAVFARGFVSNYARLLGLAPEALLSRMQGAPAAPAAVSNAVAPPPHSWLTSPWLILLLLGLLVVVAAPVMLYLWLNSEGDDELAARVPAAASSRSVAVPDAVPAPGAALPETAPDSAAGATDSAEPASAEPASAEPSSAEGATPKTEAGKSVLHLEFGDESWVEIKDASGRMLHRQLNPPASSADVRGQPPFDVVIGNAAQARITYNGRPIDLKPFTDGTVARFTLEE
jgi:cytoskeleton protein RodZ